MQKRYINYKADISSFEANDKFSGLIPSTLYSGFDTITNVSGLRFRLSHNDGVQTTNLDEQLTPRLGIWVTNQGTVIKETEAIELAIETNAGNAAKRIDILIGKHYHDVLEEGGVPATYEVIKGNFNNFKAPLIPEPALSTVLGMFTIPEESGSMTGVTFERVRVPMLGGEMAALLDYVNKYTKQQQFAQGEARTIGTATYEIDGRGILTGLDSGNTFRISGGNTSLDLIEDRPNGTEINLMFNNDTTIRGMQNNVQPGGIRVGYTRGMRPIHLGYQNAQSQIIKRGQIVKLVKVDSGFSYVNNSTVIGNIYGDFWKLISVSDSPERVSTLESALEEAKKQLANTSTALGNLVTEVNKMRIPRSYIYVDYKGVYSDDFDGTGLGRKGTIYWGYAECNGQNGTPDNSYRFMLPRFTHKPADGQDLAPFVIGEAGGASEHFLSRTELPKVAIPLKVGTINAVPTQSNVGMRPRRGTVVSIGSKAALPLDPDNVEEGLTEELGSSQAFSLMNPYRTVMQLMWVGIPS